MTSCARCGHELGVGRFCTNCGHPLGAPVPQDALSSPADESAPLPDQPGPAWPAWVPWAAGAIVVLLLGVVLTSCLGDDEPAREGQESGSGSTARPEHAATKRPARPSDVARFVRVRAPTPAPARTDLDGELVGYEARQMTDGVPQTCWRMPGDGTGEVIEFRLREPTTLTRVGLVNGYAKALADGLRHVDWYPQNRRITAVEWTFDDGTTVGQSLGLEPRLQVLRIDPVPTRIVRLRIVSVTAPAAGSLGRDYTPIRDVMLVGAPA